MAAGTSEPNLAETSSPLSSTLAALSWGDIQPEPGAAEELWRSGSSSWFIFPQCRSYTLSCRRRVCGQNLQHCIVINPLKDHKHAHGFCYLIRQPRRRRQRAINVFHIPLLNHVSRHRFLIGYVMGHMWVSPRWRIIYICPWACLTLFWCFWFCLFWFQEELIESSSDDEESGPQDEKKSASVVDVEDLGNIMNSVKKAKVRFWYEWL